MRAPLLALTVTLSGAALLAAAGCSAGSGASSAGGGAARGGGAAAGRDVSGAGASSTGTSGADTSGADTSGADASGAGAAGPGSAATRAGAAADPLARSVVRTGDLVVEVADVAAAARRAGAAARAVAGTVEREQIDAKAGGEREATLLLRVPGARLDDVVERIAALGHEVSRQLGSEDVTDRAVDLDSRLATQRRSVARVRALLDRARSIGEVVRIEGELTGREAELESVLARRAALTCQLERAALTVELQQGPARVAAAGGATGFADGLSGGWRVLRAAGTVLAVTAGALLPFLPALALLAWLAWRVRSRRGAGARTAPQPSSP